MTNPSIVQSFALISLGYERLKIPHRLEVLDADGRRLSESDEFKCVKETMRNDPMFKGMIEQMAESIVDDLITNGRKAALARCPTPKPGKDTRLGP